MTRMLERLRESGRGMASVEFAFAAPILLTMYLGGFQLMDGMSAYRKVTGTTRTIADLTSQVPTVSDADLDEILAASKQVMKPYESTEGTYRVSLITVDSGGSAKVTWSRALGISPLVTGATFNLATNLKKPGMVYVVSDVSFVYKPLVAGYMLGAFTLKDQIFMMPRGSATVKKV